MQGGSDGVIEALSRRDVEGAPISEAERALMRFVLLVTQHAWRTTAQDVQLLRDAGWSDEQIGEAVYITALFAFFNRVADAFGLPDPGYRSLAATTPPVAASEIAATTPQHGAMPAPASAARAPADSQSEASPPRA